jgi:hypothetical protein
MSKLIDDMLHYSKMCRIMRVQWLISSQTLDEVLKLINPSANVQIEN